MLNLSLEKKVKNCLKLKNISKIYYYVKRKKTPNKDIYEPIKISGAFRDNLVEYKSDSEKDKSLSIACYLNKIREYLRKMIENKKKSGEWKIQLVIKINFISSKSFNETRVMYSKSDNYEIMMGVNTNEIIKNLFSSLLQRYQKGLEESMRRSDFTFDYVESLNYIFHKIDLKISGSYIETPKWIKDKKATINVKNDDNKCFQYSITNALNYDKIKKNHQDANKVKKCVQYDQYDSSGINFPSGADDWKKF